MSEATRKPDAQTAAAVILMLGAIDALDDGGLIVSKFATDDDNDDGVWRMSFEMVNRSAPDAPERPVAVERAEPAEPLTKCPLCSQVSLGADDRCRNCQYPD